MNPFNPRKEPAIFGGISAILIANAISPVFRWFGIELEPEAIAGFITVLVAILSVVTRQQVTPISKIERLEDQGVLKPGTVEKIIRQEPPKAA